jgi:hypothetical protein
MTIDKKRLFGDEIDYIRLEDIDKINAYQFIYKLC